ncbi:unnamed protein product [Pieris brassicae]|uniref:Uncharacterized protein n=1 Tax=Pieris brassicae TaxID=7116 RepID=A0A9P0T0Z8_PIEBR|nr:unnamed protein product [Pieris brassicae]
MKIEVLQILPIPNGDDSPGTIETKMQTKNINLTQEQKNQHCIDKLCRQDNEMPGSQYFLTQVTGATVGSTYYDTNPAKATQAMLGRKLVQNQFHEQALFHSLIILET